MELPEASAEERRTHLHEPIDPSLGGRRVWSAPAHPPYMPHIRQDLLLRLYPVSRIHEELRFAFGERRGDDGCACRSSKAAGDNCQHESDILDN